MWVADLELGCARYTVVGRRIAHLVFGGCPLVLTDVLEVMLLYCVRLAHVIQLARHRNYALHTYEQPLNRISPMLHQQQPRPTDASYHRPATSCNASQP